MLTGKLWLDCIDEEEYWSANVDRCIMRDDEILLEFSGHDPDEGRFTGEFKLTKQDAIYMGPGSFLVGGKSYSAYVSVMLKKEGKTILLTGSWRNASINTSYNLDVELSESPAQKSPSSRKVEPDDAYSLVLNHLMKRGPARPRKVEALKVAIRAIVKKPISDSHLETLIRRLKVNGKIIIGRTNVRYLI